MAIQLRCPYPNCDALVAKDDRYCHTCATPLCFCAGCGVANRSQARFCRGCAGRLIAEVKAESADYQASRILTMGLSSCSRPRSWGGYYWFFNSDGDVVRLSPYAWREPHPWLKLSGRSHSLTPPAIYSGGLDQVPDPYLVVMDSHQVLAISLINSRRTKTLYSAPAGRTLLCNTKGTEYHAVAAWAQGVAFLEAEGNDHRLVICPFKAEPWRSDPIPDSPVIVGPVGRDHLICFSTNDRLYWCDVSEKKMNSSMSFAGKFQPLRSPSDLDVANLAPGITPLSIELSNRGKRAYLLGQIERRAYCVEVDLATDSGRMTPPASLPAGAFVDVNAQGNLIVNASTEVREFTGGEVKRYSPVHKLRGSMPVVLSNGDIIGFSDGSSGPVLSRRRESTALPGDVPDCNEQSTIGWIHRDNGVALMVRDGREMKIVSWDRVNPLGMAERAHA